MQWDTWKSLNCTPSRRSRSSFIPAALEGKIFIWKTISSPDSLIRLMWTDLQERPWFTLAEGFTWKHLCHLKCYGEELVLSSGASASPPDWLMVASENTDPLVFFLHQKYNDRGYLRDLFHLGPLWYISSYSFPSTHCVFCRESGCYVKPPPIKRM